MGTVRTVGGRFGFVRFGNAEWPYGWDSEAACTDDRLYETRRRWIAAGRTGSFDGSTVVEVHRRHTGISGCRSL